MRKGKYGISLGNERNHLGKEQNSTLTATARCINAHFSFLSQFFSLSYIFSMICLFSSIFSLRSNRRAL